MRRGGRRPYKKAAREGDTAQFKVGDPTNLAGLDTWWARYKEILRTGDTKPLEVCDTKIVKIGKNGQKPKITAKSARTTKQIDNF